MSRVRLCDFCGYPMGEETGLAYTGVISRRAADAVLAHDEHACEDCFPRLNKAVDSLKAEPPPLPTKPR